MDFIALESAKLHYVFENIFHVVERLVSKKEAKMNKIFKVIWSKSKQCYVVVSELAKNTTGKKKIIVAGIFSALAIVQFGQVAQVQADGSIGSSNHKGSIVINGTWKAGYTYAKATDENAIAIGQNAQATGRGGVALGNDTQSAQNSIAAAWDSQATGKNSVAVGTGTRATGLSSTAVGDSAQATVNRAVALGTDTRATGLSSTAVGDSAQATANGAVALGQSTESAGNSVAAGFNAKARSNNTVAIGVEANNDGSITNNASSVSVGVATRARAVGSMAMGVSADASGKYSLALGSGDVGTDYTAGTNYPSASGEKSIAIGYKSNASDLNALAIGTGASVDKQNATAVGSGASVTGHNATAVGNDTKAIKQYDNAFGYTSTASGGAATAVGYYATASGNNAVALGSTINTTAQYATGIGYSVNSQGEGAVAIGAGTDALGAIPAKQVKATAKNAIAIGRATQATSQDATAIGTEATASNTDAIAIGRKSNASGSTSIGFGYNTQSTDTNTVAIGTDVSATAESAIALGRKTTASALNATAVGPIANASGKYSSAFGMSAVASKENSLALGTDANASQASGVALGYSSTANTASGVAGYNPNTGHSDTYTALSGKTLTSTLGAVSVGNATNTRQITGVAAGTADTDAVNVAQLKSVNLAFTGNTGNGGDVNLSKSKLAVEGGTNSFITTEAANKKLEIKTTQGKLKNTTGTVSVDGDNGLAVAQNVADVINQANADQSIKYKANGTGSNSVKLSDGLNFTNGTTTTATVGANGQVTFDLNTATQKSITDSATAVARTISLGGDTGTTTAKSLTSGNVNFGVKSGSSTYLTTTANGNDVTLTVNEQAIKNAAKDASSFKVKANSTAAADVKGGDTVAFNNGDNIAITQTGKTFKIATSKNVTFDTATIGGNTTIGSTGITTNKVTVGGISIDGTNGINAGGKQITNVASGGTTATNAANIGDINAAISSLTTNLGKNTTIAYKANNAGGQTVSLADGFNFTNGTLTTAEVDTSGVVKFNVTQGALSTDTNGTVSAGTAGVATTADVASAVNSAVSTAVNNATSSQKLDISDGTTDGAVNLKTQKLTVAGTGAATATLNNQTITVNVAEGTFTNNTDGTTTATAGVAKAADVASAINNANTALSKKITDATASVSTLGSNTFTLKADSTDTTAQALNKSGGLAFKVAGDGNLTSTTATGDTVTVSIKQGIFGSNADGTAKSTTNGVATTGDVATIVNTTVSNAVNNATSNQNLTIGGDTAATGTVNIKNDTLSVKGDGKFISTAASGKAITLTVNEQAIKDTAKDAASFKVKANKNTAEEVKGGETVTFNDGDNIAITQNGKTFTIATSKNVTFDTATIGGNTTIGSTGVTTNKVTVGAISIDGTNGINAGNKAITNVGTGIVANSNADNSNVANIGDVKTIANDAVANLSTNLGVTDGTNNGTVNLKTEKLKVVGTGAATATVNGQTITVDVAKGTLAANAATGALTGTAGVVDANDMATAVNTAITKAVDNATGNQALKIGGDNAATGSVNLKSDTLSVKGDNKFIKTAASGNDITLTVDEQAIKTAAKDAASFKVKANSEAEQEVKGGETVAFNNGDNIEITQTGKTFSIATKKDVTFDSAIIGTNTTIGSTGITTNKVTVGGISIDSTNGINAGGKQITNVASGGTTATNAANIGDINTAISNLTTNLGKNTTIAYKANGTGGQTVSLADGFNFTNGTLTTAEVAANGVVKFNVTQGALSTDTNGTVSAGTLGVATTADVASAVNSAVSTAVNNATSNQKLDISAGGTDSSVNLKTQKLTVAGTGAATTSVAGQTITVNVAEGTLTPNTTTGDVTGSSTGVAKAADVASAINNANTALSKKITDATASVSTLGSNTFTLKADSTDTTAQALNKSGGLAFKVAGDSDLVSTSATADTVKVTVKKGTLTTNADGTLNKTTDGVVTADNMKTVVNDAITKAVTSAKDGSAWNISTNGGTATKVSGGNTVDLINGDNIEITQDGTDGKKITVKTKKDLTVDSVTAANTVKVGSAANLITLDGATGAVSGNTFTAGNASMNTTGFRLTGGPSVTTAGIDAGGKQITNMISGGTTATNAATIGDVDTKVGDAITNLTTNLTKNTNIAYTANGAAAGQTVSLKDGFNFSDGTLTTVEVAANGVVKFNVTQGSLSTDANGNITNTGGVATTDDVKNAVTSAINTAVTKATGSQVLNITDGTNNGSINLKNDALKVVGADGVTTEVSGKTITVGLDTATKDKINNANTATNRNISLAADSGATSSQSLKDGDVSFAVKGATGDYISTNMNGSTVEISTKRATINSNATTGEASVTGNDGLATAKNVADAINAATTKAVAQSAWKLSADGGTTTETISGGDTVNFAAGKNIEITRTGKEIKVAMKDDVTFNKLNVGTGANAIGIDGTNGKITAKDIAATGDVSANNVTATGLVKGDTVQGNTVKAGNVTITGGTTNTITGLSNTTWSPTGGIQVDRAATEGQLQQAINQVNNAVGNTALTFKGDSNSAQTMTLKDNTFAITGDTMIKTTTNTSGIGLSLDTSKVNIVYAANGANGQTTSLTSGFNFTDGDHTKATVAANGVVKYDAKTSSITVTNGQATASGTDLATADNVAHAINQMTQANAGNTTQLRQEINKVATETQRVGAHAAAMAALKPIQYDPLEPTQVMAGVGNYHGETAAALGLAHYTNENTMFNVGVSLGGNHNMVNAGVTHKFGSSPEKKNIPDRYKAGPISSIYVMQDEMTQLRTENESYKAKLDQQQSEIDALKAAVDKLLAAKA